MQETKKDGDAILCPGQDKFPSASLMRAQLARSVYFALVLTLD